MFTKQTDKRRAKYVVIEFVILIFLFSIYRFFIYHVGSIYHLLIFPSPIAFSPKYFFFAISAKYITFSYLIGPTSCYMHIILYDYFLKLVQKEEMNIVFN